MASVFDIRGTHGSGKSHLMHSLLSSHEHIPLLDGKTHLGYSLPEIKTVLIGKYKNKCGGCDGIKTPAEVVRRVKLFYDLYPVVLLEGILVSHTFQRYSDLATELENYNFCFLNTPKQICIDRVLARRSEAGNDKPFDPRNVEHDYKQIWTNVQSKCRAKGHLVTVLDYRHVQRQLLSMIAEASQ